MVGPRQIMPKIKDDLYKNLPKTVRVYLG